MSSTTKSTSNTANTFGTYKPDASEFAALKDYNFAPDPSIGFRYAAARQNVEEGPDNPLGPYVTPEQRQQSQRSQLENLNQSEGQAKSQDNARISTLKYANLLDYIDRTKSQLIQTGGSTQGTQTTPVWPSLLNSLVGGAATVGGAFAGR